MSDVKHTAGWTSAEQVGPPGRCHMAQVFGADGKALAFVEPTNPPSLASDRARLIAAAPTMLEALTGLDAYWAADFPEGPDGSRVALGGFGTVSDDTMQVWRNVRAAIAKASGETP